MNVVSGPGAIIEITRISGAIKLISKAGRSREIELSRNAEHLTKLFVFCDCGRSVARIINSFAARIRSRLARFPSPRSNFHHAGQKFSNRRSAESAFAGRVSQRLIQRWSFIELIVRLNGRLIVAKIIRAGLLHLQNCKTLRR